jgi:hypothetical protein
MDAQGSSGSPNSGRVFVSSERPIPGSLATGRSGWRLGHECISFRRGVFERRLPRIRARSTAAGSDERIAEPVGCCEQATRSGNPDALGSSPGKKGALERGPFLSIGRSDVLCESCGSILVAAAAFVPWAVRSRRGVRHRVCARGKTVSLS